MTCCETSDIGILSFFLFVLEIKKERKKEKANEERKFWKKTRTKAFSTKQMKKTTDTYDAVS